MALGVANDDVAPVIARVLAERGTRGMVFRGFDGLDELTTTSESDVWMIAEGRVHRTTLNPEDLGLEPAAPHDLDGGDAPHNAQVARDMLAGKPGPVRDIVVLNAAAALLAYRGISTVLPLVDQMREPLGLPRTPSTPAPPPPPSTAGWKPPTGSRVPPRSLVVPEEVGVAHPFAGCP